MRRTLALASLVCGLAAGAQAASANVLRVGTYHGIKGQYSSVQAAVNAARPGDWILIAPGDYKTSSSRTPGGRSDLPAGVLVTTPNLHIRGLNRNTVVIDGTKSGRACSARRSDQNFGPGGRGLNGIMVWKANNVSVENLTACNFLGGTGTAGNEIWWNGGDGGGQIGGWGFYGAYLNATSSYYQSEATAAQYGIFSSDWSGGTWDTTYVSNFNDSGYYIGACQQACDQTLNHGWSEYNALGYSGTNSGGSMLIENSQFDQNEDGFDTNSQNNSDWPSPQDGACPAGVRPPVAGAPTCWVFIHNNVHDNNNPYVPAAGAAAAGPVGTGMSVSGGRDDTIMDNQFVNNGAWGTIFVPYPDTETPPSNAPSCRGGIQTGSLCNYDDWGNFLIGNSYTHDGYFNNPTNGDFAETTTTPDHPANCYRGNTATGGTLTTSPATLVQTNGTCGQTQLVPDLNPQFTAEVLCDSMFEGPSTPCPPNANYPRSGGKVIMHPLPTSELASMPNPCAGVPSDPWCNPSKHKKPHHKKRKGRDPDHDGDHDSAGKRETV